MNEINSILFCTIVVLVLLLLSLKKSFTKSTFGKDMNELLKPSEDLFPYRLLCDEERNIIPVIALTAFFRSDKDRERFREYTSSGIKVIGYTSYKTFPKPIADESGDQDSLNDTFEYTKEIKNWVVCFKNPEEYGFTNNNNLLEMSESDFKDAEDFDPVEKKYDFIYSCLGDDDESCPLNGWNAINRNYNLALKCFPIMVNEFNLKILVVGRKNCGLEKLYPNNITVVDMLPYHDFQTKLKESRFLFVPNIYDASPRVVTEAISKDIPVFMNRHIVCGSKYINYNTGELFTDEHDIRYHLKKLLDKTDKTKTETPISPKKWWKENYSVSLAGVTFKNFLQAVYPDVSSIQIAKEVRFY